MKTIKIIVLLATFTALLSLRSKSESDEKYYSLAELRMLYSSGDITKYPRPEVDSTVINFQELGTLPPVVFPADNPYNEAKRELGKILFFDPRLSSSNQISCASCHDPELGWGDGKRVSNGHDRTPGKRNAKPIINSAYASLLFWDGRAESLEDQAKFPIEDEKEMNHDIKKAVKKIKKIKGYKPLFKEAFGDEQITNDRIMKAIATFERTVVSKKSRFDKFIEGDSTQLTDQEVLGLHLFRTKARCINCHNSPYFSDNQFHNAGLTYYKRKYEDLGLYAITKKPEDVGKFRTPSLREIMKTAPYMHNGLFPEIRGVLNMYNAGMPNLKPKDDDKDDILFPKTSPLLKKLNLDASELDALEAFLGSITSVIYREPAPEELPQ
ncbi:cytochrome-c peroxidase [Flavobacterium sediminis]|uniref:Methylamine utilization protein MauG n=1 Tax=Flavobacterium sediminis TaxID=2201181 RepID=A0A2U8QQU9_9FLAO|nr:cytochrome c peroxidase [Flavobacterium sediminis]AWM12431.1 cytochrome-c peroxidase [Flavobacterium sediminis]